MQSQLITVKAAAEPVPPTDPELTALGERMAALAAELDALREQWRARWRVVKGYEEVTAYVS